MEYEQRICITIEKVGLSTVQNKRGSKLDLRVPTYADSETLDKVKDLCNNHDFVNFDASEEIGGFVPNTPNAEGSEASCPQIDTNFDASEEIGGAINNPPGGAVPNAPNAESYGARGPKILSGLAVIIGCLAIVYDAHQVGEASKAVVQAVNGWKESGYAGPDKCDNL